MTAYKEVPNTHLKNMRKNLSPPTGVPNHKKDNKYEHDTRAILC